MRGLLVTSLVVSLAAETVHLHRARGVEFLSTERSACDRRLTMVGRSTYLQR
jgi:hypothetical protein